jgi:3-deoxy-D-manno-octulosonate 8-phosphate phosphatase (KDO 8-P phosphatase)
MTSTVIVIPARYASTRLPGKPLLDIIGKPMIQHVVERANEVAGVSAVIVATDDERVFNAVQVFGGTAMMTSANHQSGTDRLVEVMHQYPADIYLNLQGDEPLVRPSDLSELVDSMQASDVQVGTLCHRIDAHEATNPNCVKVVVNNKHDALYFSRSPIPYPREASKATYLKHVGVYAYKKDILASYSQLKRPMLEISESLEQLRLLDAGIQIKVIEVEPTGPGVDTQKDLEQVRAILAGEAFLTQPTETELLAKIKLVITDVDGVLTDGGIYYDETGECIKRFHVRDGLGIKMLEESGVRVAVLSGRDSATLRKRVADLGITIFSFGVKDKSSACKAMMLEVNVTAEQTACIGDDSIDLPAFEACGLAYAVADAAEYVQKKAYKTLKLAGGQGAFRELSDAILTAQGKSEILGSAQGFSSVMDRMAQ